jgi:hypothetical protein
MADAYIAQFDEKFYSGFWRPVTAIHEADNDGNRRTVSDPTWAPLRPTPPFPEYSAAHAAVGAAAAEAMKRFFGTDDIAFEACSLTLPAGSRCTDPTPVLRSYSSFSQAADENGVSRIYVGIHFRTASEEGVKHGRKIARRAAELFLRPVH